MDYTLNLNKRVPDFKNMQLVLEKKVPKRPTLFEFFLNGPLYNRLAVNINSKSDSHDTARWFTKAYTAAGYDYVTLSGASNYTFPVHTVKESKSSYSLNGGDIVDRAGFDSIKDEWMDPNDADYSTLEAINDDLPDGMKVIAYGPGGVLENVIALCGYDNLCYMVYEDEQLVYDLFEKVGSGLVKFYEICGKYKSVGAMISNDDWGFKTQPMLSPEQCRKYLFPWHKKIVETIHAAGVPSILHSCGNYSEIIDDVIDDMKYDGRHSYEDAIKPVEDCYEELVGRIAVMGGIDVNFIATATPEEVFNRSRKMIERTSSRGGWALGTGNSVPEFIPQENYLAMIDAVLSLD